MRSYCTSNQTADPQTGWTTIRPLGPDVFQYLAAAHACPLLLSSATVSEASLGRICENVSVAREELAVLYMSPDRLNIFQQVRQIRRTLSIG